MGKSKKSSGGASSAEINIDPVDVRFTHSRIRPFFTGCGKKIEDTLKDLLERRISIEALPLITVVKGLDGHLFSLNNRRLYVIKQLRTAGILENNMIKVRLKPALKRELERYTVERCSLEATMMKTFGSGDTTVKEERNDDEEKQEEGKGETTPNRQESKTKTKAGKSVQEEERTDQMPAVVKKQFKGLLKSSRKSPPEDTRKQLQGYVDDENLTP
jgi:hypothetical protein